jgi:hypothetical protein
LIGGLLLGLDCGMRLIKKADDKQLKMAAEIMSAIIH